MSSTTIFILVPHGFCSLNLYVLLVKSGLIGEIQIVGETYIFIGWLPRFRWLNRIPIFMSDLPTLSPWKLRASSPSESCRSDICTVKTAGNKRRMPWRNQQSNNQKLKKLRSNQTWHLHDWRPILRAVPTRASVRSGAIHRCLEELGTGDFRNQRLRVFTK
jgi:hypothetical protein